MHVLNSQKVQYLENYKCGKISIPDKINHINSMEQSCKRSRAVVLLLRWGFPILKTKFI